MTIYAVRIHDRITEDDPTTGTVMYTIRGEIGPWHDMVTGDVEWCWEVRDALDAYERMRSGG